MSAEPEELYHLGVKALIKNARGEYLLLRMNPEDMHGHGKSSEHCWDLPGGRVQRGDSIEATLTREIEEELDIRELSIGRPVDTVLSPLRITLSSGLTVGLILRMYKCSIPADAPIRLSFEHAEYKWVPPAEAAMLLRVKYPQDFCERVAEL